MWDNSYIVFHIFNPAGIALTAFFLGCAYADGCFSAEETILAAYFRGKCIQEANLPAGKQFILY